METLLKTIHIIGSIIAIIICFFVICFIITLLCMFILQVVLGLMCRLVGCFFGNIQESQEYLDLERGIIALRSPRSTLVFWYSWPRRREEREGRRRNLIDQLLPLVAYRDGETNLKAGDGCAICLDDYRNGELCRVLSSCKHMFHSSCVDPWFSKSLTCPVCRQHVFGECG